MSRSSLTIRMQGLLDKMRSGDRQARQTLIELAYQKLCEFTQRVLARDYTSKFQRAHSRESIVHLAWMRLEVALDSVLREESNLTSIDEFFYLASKKIRETLKTLAKKENDRLERTDEHIGEEVGTSVQNPEQLARLREVYETIERLPTEQRTVFQRHVILGASQAEIADELQVPPRTVSRLIARAKIAIGKRLED